MKPFIFLFAFAILTGSCAKQTGLASITITVVTPAGIPVQNTNVLLSVPIANTAQFYGITDEDGKIMFKSGLEAYFDLTVWKGLWKGCDFVRFNPGEESKVTVIIYPPANVFNGCIQ